MKKNILVIFVVVGLFTFAIGCNNSKDNNFVDSQNKAASNVEENHSNPATSTILNQTTSFHFSSDNKSSSNISGKDNGSQILPSSDFSSAMTESGFANKQEIYNYRDQLLLKKNNTKDYRELITQVKQIDASFTPYRVHPLQSSRIYISQYDQMNPIECLREMDNNRLYAVQKLSDGSVIYSFFYHYNWVCSITSRKILHQNDFAFIKSNDSIEKVKKIDPETSKWEADFDDLRWPEKVSRHLLKDGIIEFKYQLKNGEFVIAEKNIYPNFKAKTKVGEVEYTYDYSILPQDYIH